LSESGKPRKDGKVLSKAGRVRRARKAFKAVEPVLVPLLELFADVDEVFAEQGAFDPGNIHKSLGRIYRSWLDTRESLDSGFDREKYRQEMKRPSSRMGLTVPPASGSPKRSTARTSTSDKNPKKTAKREKPSAKKSATGARSGGSASRGR
jgi:hypothetical protein